MNNRMNKYILIALFLLLSILSAHADGPPVKEDGTITTEYIAIKIDSHQIKQVEKTHIVDLSASQHSLLKEYYKNLPKKFVVVTPHYNDCTCDLIYLIWNKTDTIVLPLDSVDYFKELLGDKEHPYDYQGLLKNWIKQKIIIDTKGNFHYKGKSLSKGGLEDLFKNIAKDKDEFARWIAISLPPYLKTEYEGKVDSAIEEIKKIAEKYKVKAQIGG
jgi:hypothetical protein